MVNKPLSENPVGTRFLKIAKVLLLPVMLMFNSQLYAQQKTYYRASDGTIITAAKLDSIIAAKNKKLKALGFTLQKTISKRSVSHDSIIYDFTLNAANKAVVTNAKRYSAYIGKPLPAFSFNDVTGRVVDSKTLKGKPLVINMWFTTCAPCIAEMPQLNTIKHDPKNANVKFIAITFDGDQKVRDFLKKKPFDFIQLAGQPAYCKQFTDDFPITIFVDKAGIIQTIQGGMPVIYDSKRKTFTDRVDPADFNEALAKIK